MRTGDKVFPPASPAFPQTRWTLIDQLRGEEEAQALETLCAAYWYPVYAYVRQRGWAPEDAEDLAQEFFCRFVRKGSFARAMPERGRLRTFILESLKRLLTDAHRRRMALKRSTGRAVLSIEAEAAEMRFQNEPFHRVSPDVLFERRWVGALLQHVMGRLEVEWERRGRTREFVVLQRYIPGHPIEAPHSGAAERLGRSVTCIRKEIYRLRRQFYAFLRQEVAATVRSRAEVEEELAALLAVFED